MSALAESGLMMELDTMEATAMAVANQTAAEITTTVAPATAHATKKTVPKKHTSKNPAMMKKDNLKKHSNA